MLGEIVMPESVIRRSYAFERLSAPAAVLDTSGVVVETNEAWRLFAALNAGVPDTTGPGADYLAVCDRAYASGVETAGVVAAGLRSILRGERGSFEIEYPCPSPIEDRWFVLHAATAPVHEGAGVVLFHVNVTARKLLEQRLGPEAACDPKTGLPDRGVAIRLIEGGLAATAPEAGRLTVINVSVAGIGAVREELGRPAAEELLVQVTARARCALRVSDHFCQLGGDRLVVVCPGLDDTATAGVVDRLRDAIAAPFQVGTDKVSVAASVVVVVADAGSTAESLLTAAATAGTIDVWADRRAQRSAVAITRPPCENAAAPATADAWARADGLVASAAAKAQRDAVVAHSDDLVMYFEADGTIAWASPATRALFGMDPEALVGRNSLDLIHPDDKEHALTELSGISGFGEHTRCEFRVITDDGAVYWIEETATNLIDDPQVGYVVGNLHDITARKRDEEAIALQSRLLDAAGQAIIAVDMHGDVFYWNAAATHIYGWTADEARGRPATELLVPAAGWADRAEAVRDHVVVGEEWSGDFLVRRKDGSEVPVLVANTAVLDDAGVQIGIIAVSSDITDRKQLERDLWHQANYDALTGLANRTLLLDRLDAMLAPSGTGAADTRVGILLFDVDRFKVINDSLGHDRGDQLLVAIADALRRNDRARRDRGRDSAATRFAVVIADPRRARAGARHCRTDPGATGQRVGRRRRSLPADRSASAWSSRARPTPRSLPSATPRRRCTAPRRTGRDRAEWFDPSLHRDVVANFEVERDLRRAIEHGPALSRLPTGARPRDRRDRELRGTRSLAPSRTRRRSAPTSSSRSPRTPA